MAPYKIKIVCTCNCAMPIGYVFFIHLREILINLEQNIIIRFVEILSCLIFSFKTSARNYIHFPKRIKIAMW